MRTILITIILLFALNHSSFAAKAVNFKLPTDKGKISLSSLKGKVVYVDFWASWCPPCRKSFPWMNKMHAKYKKKGLVIVGINLDSTRDSAKKFLKKMPALFKVAYDHEGKMADAYDVQVMPTSYLIDRKGNIAYVHKGFSKKHEDKLEKAFLKALK